MTREEFFGNELVLDAVAKCIEAVGEASVQLMKVDPGIGERFPDLQLKRAYAACNQLSHGYFAIDPAILWRTFTESLPATVAEARRVIALRGESQT